MPTAVSVARQCLAPDAAHALDEAVAVARRRGHAQTTSLHAISALLSLPSSALRDACARARKTAYSPRLQFKALELCLSVSLDRLPSTQLTDDPPVSNSLMAAIKRSQANQRRQPENFHLYHQLSQQSSIACVKVELQHFILSILDDPVVSRVFGEAGFRSSEIKLAIIRPFPQLLRYSSRTRGPPMFLCNLMDYSDPSRRGFLFPLSGFRDGDENNRRIGEVLSRNRGRNPLLVGVCAYVALKSFTETVEKRNDNILPEELSGLRTISLENDFSRFLSENSETGSLNMRFMEVVQMVEQSPEPGLIVNFGDLKAFVGDNSSDDRASHVVGQLKRLVDLHGEKVWLIGAAASYETYLRFVTKFPSIEKDWDLHLLPITSLRPCAAESYPRTSLMGSFVPLGGFFSTPSDATVPLSGSCQHSSRCHQCDKNCEEEVIAASKGVFAPSLSEQYQSSLPAWMQIAELSNFDGFDAKTRDDGLVLSAKIAGLQKKWDNICQRLHHNQPLKEANMFPTIVGFQVSEDKRGDAVNNCSSTAYVSSSHKDPSSDLNSCNFMDLPKISLLRSNTFPLSSEAKNNNNFLSKLQEERSKTEDLELGGHKSTFSLSISSVDDENRTSSPSAGSVTTDLGLGIVSLPTTTSYKLKKPLNHNSTDFPSDLSGCGSTNVDLVNGKVCNGFTPSSSWSSPEQRGQMNAMDVKTLLRLLKERVFWQDQAVSIISQTISRCQTRSDKRHGSNLRGDIWFNFFGPDKFGKKKVAIALAEILYGNKDQLVCVDLSSHDGTINTDTLLGRPQMKSYNVEFRGKTVLDFVAAELSKQPLSVVLLENVDKADLLDQNRLSQAIQTGKLSDLQGREVSIKNVIFLMTSTSLITKQRTVFPDKQTSKYSEERLLKAKSWPLQIKVDSSKTVSDTEKRSSRSPNPTFMNKRKLNVIDESSNQHETSETVKRSNKLSNRCLDLNRPAEENVQHDIDDDCPDNNSISELSKTWFQEFCSYIDQVVVFKAFDFNTLAEKTLEEIKKIFHSVFGSESTLEIESKVVEQLLAAAYISYGNREVDDWMEQVLSRKFSEVKRINSLSAYSVVRLATCEEELSMEEKAAEVCLPKRIVLEPKSCSS